MNILIQEAKSDHIKEILKMNQNLMEDEQFDRVLTFDQLFRKWHNYFDDSNYKAFLFIQDKIIVGYALVQIDLKPMYLRHFFIKEEFRRKGVGTHSFNLLVSFLNVNTLDLDAMSLNEKGLQFWKSVGFAERCKMMTLKITR